MPRKTKMANAAETALPSIPTELIDQFVTGPMSADAVNAASMAFKKALIERALGAELSHHLGYTPGAAKPEDASNQRNGKSGKTVLTEDGPLRIEVPRDRDGSFEPMLIPKHERRFTGFDDKIVAMYARGMTVREVQGFLAEQYGVEVSPEFISSVTDAVMAEVTAWQARPLEPMYPVVFFDAASCAAARPWDRSSSDSRWRCGASARCIGKDLGVIYAARRIAVRPCIRTCGRGVCSASRQLSKVRMSKESPTKTTAFMKPLKPSAALAAVVGAEPLPRTEVTKRIWDYIKAHNLQNPANKRNILCDPTLRAVMGKDEVTMFEMTGLVGKHLAPI